MKKIFKIINILLLLCVFSGNILFGNTQRILLTGSQHTGSYIFATELSRLWESFNKFRETSLVKKIEISQKNRLKQIANNGISLTIVDAKTTFENINDYPNLRVLTVLWKNWLYAIGSSQKPFLTFENTKTFLIHENSVYFSQLWKTISPKTKFQWFNKNNIPNLDKDFSEEVVIFTGPKNLDEIFNWLEQFAGIHLLSIDKKIVKSLSLNYKWLIPKKLPANTYPYQSESLLGLTWHPVLVTNASLPDDFARNLLKIIFSQKGKINPHPLFKDLLIKDNITFRKIFPYHSSSKNLFRFK